MKIHPHSGTTDCTTKARISAALLAPIWAFLACVAFVAAGRADIPGGSVIAEAGELFLILTLGAATCCLAAGTLCLVWIVIVGEWSSD